MPDPLQVESKRTLGRIFKTTVLASMIMLAAFLLSGQIGSRAKPAEAATVSVSIVNQGCLSDGSVRIVVTWDSSVNGTLFVDLSTRNNPFAQGNFIGAGGFNPFFPGFTWDGLIPGQRHFIRANVLTPFGFVPSTPLSFMTPSCFPGFAAPAFSTAPVVVTVSQECLANHLVRARFSWNSTGLGPQFIDVSSVSGFFFPGAFTGFSVPTFQNNFVLDNLGPGQRLFVRVNTLTPFGWLPSGVASFVTRTDC
jgi:hypothetical protein